MRPGRFAIGHPQPKFSISLTVVLDEIGSLQSLRDTVESIKIGEPDLLIEYRQEIFTATKMRGTGLKLVYQLLGDLIDRWIYINGIEGDPVPSAVLSKPDR